jgi:hypothetical protein
VKYSQQSILLALVVITAVVMLAFVGISAYTEGDASPTLLLFIGVVTPISMGVVALLKQERTLKVSEQTDQKVDELLNGSLVGRVASLEADMSIVKTAVLEIHNTVSK